MAQGEHFKSVINRIPYFMPQDSVPLSDVGDGVSDVGTGDGGYKWGNLYKSW